MWYTKYIYYELIKLYCNYLEYKIVTYIDKYLIEWVLTAYFISISLSLFECTNKWKPLKDLW